MTTLRASPYEYIDVIKVVWIVLFFLNMCMNGFFRFFGAITSSFFLATQITGVLLIAIASYTGYTIPYNKMHPWLFW